MKESKAMMKKEVAFMKKKGAPKSMIRHEEAEYGMKKGVKKMQMGGMSGGSGAPLPATPGAAPVAATGFTGGIGAISGPGFRVPEGRPRIQSGGMGMRRMAGGGSTGGSYRKAADGIASKGKTKGHVVKMREGGSVGGSYRKAADGIASKGKTKGKMVKMNKGGYC
jgi:hypothetical protein